MCSPEYLHYTEGRLLKDKNILYNFAAKILISKLITQNDEGKTVNILFDNKTTKIASKNSLREYIIADIVYEKGLDVNINFEYKDSDAGDAFIIQAADYVANGLYANYEYNNNIYKNLVKEKINVVQYYMIGIIMRNRCADNGQVFCGRNMYYAEDSWQ